MHRRRKTDYRPSLWNLLWFFGCMFMAGMLLEKHQANYYDIKLPVSEDAIGYD